MAGNQLSVVLRHLYKQSVPHQGNGVSDAHLLERFVERRDESAFELLLHRHGAMVWGVCHRVLRDHHDAEDAFQAAWLTLARKAGSIGRWDAVSSWMYKVAFRIALRLRTANRRRAERETQVDPLPFSRNPGEVDLTLIWRELKLVLDEEVRRLPEKLRAVVVQCYLEGKTNEEAARLLEWPVGTVKTRLARARELLCSQLAGRGLAISAAMLAATISSQAAVVALPAGLVSPTVQAALLFSAREAMVSGLVSTRAMLLTKGVLQAMMMTKLKIAAVVLAVGFACTGVGALTYRSDGGEQPAEGAKAVLAKPRKAATRPYVVEPPDLLHVDVWAADEKNPAKEILNGEHLVRPDGSIGLGVYGSAQVQGRTLNQIREAIREQLAQVLKHEDNPRHVEEVHVDVVAYNSKCFYVVVQADAVGDEVFRFPHTGQETVLDALAQMAGSLDRAAIRSVWIDRPEQGKDQPRRLPVDWIDITQRGVNVTNYQIQAGDRIHVKVEKADAKRAGAATDKKKPIAVIFGDREITHEELGEYLIRRASAERIQGFVNLRILEHAANQKGIKVSSEEVDAALEKTLKELNVTLDEFRANVLAMTKYNMTLLEWREDVVRPRLLASKLCEDRVHVTEDDLKRAFEGNYGKRVECRMIIWSHDQAATAVNDSARMRKEPELFDRIARLQEIAPLSTNGRLIEIRRHTSSSALDKVAFQSLEETAFQLKEGEISQLIIIPEGFAALKCVRSFPGDASKKLEDVRDILEKEVRAKKIEQEIPVLMNELKQKARAKMLMEP